MAMSDVSEETLRGWLSGRQGIHRLRDWTDGDTLYGVRTFSEDGGTSSGKTFREGGEHGADAEQMARDYYERPGLPMSGVTVLFRANVQNPRSEPRDPQDPGEPPLMYGTLTHVEILDWKQTGGDSDE